jgi:hypothetical protein
MVRPASAVPTEPRSPIVKPILLLALVAVFAFVNPSTRHVVEPYLGVVLNPVYRWNTEQRIAEITRALEGEAHAGRAVPNTSEALVRMLDQYTFAGEGSVDRWGTRFFIRRQGFTVRVGSAGPDRTVGTADDILGKPVSAVPR